MVAMKDLQVISYLRLDGRMKLTTMSKHTQIPVSTLHEKVKSGSCIQKHTCLLNFNQLGYSTWVTMLLKVKGSERSSLQDFLRKHCAVNSCLRLASDYDYLVECVFKDIGEVKDFTESIEEQFEIQGKVVNFIVEDIHRENFLSTPELIPLE
jgi:DNA-binding Lrp family transcriptional regulator